MRGRIILRRGTLALAVLLTVAASASEPLPAELVLTGGAVYTVDAARSWAQAVAVRGGRIVYVGSDAGIRPFVAESTRVIPLAGRMLLPGFQDAHVHPMVSGIELAQCDLNESSTREAVLARLRECARTQPGDWLVGVGWQLPVFPAANPAKELLDEITPERPAFMLAADGHSAWVSSRALALAGIDADTADPRNGRIERDPQSGEPTGTLRESALVAALVRKQFSLHVHAIGDGAVRITLDALEAAGARRGAQGPRHQLAHLEVIHPADIPRFRTLGVVANFQPLWAWADPLAGIQTAVTRRGLEVSPAAFLPGEAVGLDVAIAAYTIGSAFALGLDKETGSIEIGKLADLVVLSHDLFALPTERIASARVVLTLLEGKPVYSDPSLDR